MTAFRFREAVMESLEQLRAHPHIGSRFPGSTRGLRSWPVKGFEMTRIYYLAVPDRLRVLRILHGKRDVRQILRQENFMSISLKLRPSNSSPEFNRLWAVGSGFHRSAKRGSGLP